MRGKVSKLAMFMLVFSMTVSMFVVNASAADETTPIDACDRIVEAYDLDDAEDYINDGDASTYPKAETEGYIFAGWYTDETCGEDSYWGQEEPGDTVYALFVPSHVLDVKAQVSSNLLNEDSADDGTASIRFVTTVDTLLYNQAGFTLSYVGSDGTTKNATSSSNKVYQKLYAVGSTSTMDTEYTPKGSFCNLSTYFKACTVTKVTAENYTTKFSVAPFWKTLDGSIVYGETVEKSINDYFEQSDVYVKEDGTDAINRGSYDKPFATLDYALQYVEDGGTVHVIGAVTEDASATWTAHNKSVTITNDGKNDGTDSITFAATTVNVQDSVKFTGLGVNFASGTTIYAWGNTLEIDSDVIGLANYVTVYGGGTSAITSDTNVILRAGNYTAVYGGGNKVAVNGNTNVTLSGTINNGIDHKSHSMTYYVIGGGNSAAVNGNTNVTISDSTVYFNYIFGGGYGGAVTGDCTVNYAGSAMSVYGGGKSGYVTGDTHLIMTGGWVEQLFGGCEGSSMTGNTEVRVTGGEVKRRIYGGCYNNADEDIGMSGFSIKATMTWDETNYHVNGYTSVTVDDNANLSFDYEKDTGVLNITTKADNSLYAVSRDDAPFEEERGVLIFNDDLYSANSDKIGYDNGMLDTFGIGSYFSTLYYNYLVKAGTGGTVTAEGNCIRVVPDSGKVATVRLGSTTGTIIHYADGEGVCALPELSSATATQEIYVVFSDSTPSDVTVSNYEAKINGGYYTTVEEAFETAKAMDSATIELLKEDVEVESTLSIENSENITVKNADGVNATVHRADALTNGSIFDVDAGGTLTVDGIILDGRTPAEITAGTTDVALLTGSTASLINTAGEVHVNNVIAQYAVKTSGFGAVLYGEGVATTVVTVDSSEFNYNKSADQGGAICLYNGSSTLEIKNSSFDHNQASANGGALSTHADTAFIENCIFTNNTSTGNGGAFYSGSSCAVTVRNTTGDATKAYFRGNTASSGGAYANGSGKATFEGYTFVLNTATNQGGAIYNSGSTTTAVNCTFGGKATDETSLKNSANQGGAIYNANKGELRLSIDDAYAEIEPRFEGNSATSYGGAIRVGTGKIYVDGYTFDGNTSGASGGAIYVTGASNSAQITNSVFEGNRVTGTAGGAIHNQGAVVTIVNSKFKGNEAVTNGGAIATTDSGKMTVLGTSVELGITEATLAMFEGNIANNKATGFGGGAIYYGSGTFSVDGYAFNNNISTGDAGAIALRGTSTVTNCTFTGNSADQVGGALYCFGKATITGSTFTNNTAVGATTTTDGEGVTTTTNTGGGAIHNTNGGTTITNSSFNGNTTEQAGGAIYTSANITISDSSFTSNKASTYAGAIRNEKGTTKVTDTTFTTNESPLNGGAINNSGTLTLIGTKDTALFDRNKTTATGRTDVYGGAVYNNGTMTANKYIFTGNYNVYRGGAIGNYGKNPIITDCKFVGNYSVGNGGAVYSGGGVTINIVATGTSDLAIFEGNYATGDTGGGAISMGSGTLKLTGYKFINNYAKAGGAVYNSAGVTATIQGLENDTIGSLFKGNYATTGVGGAIYVNGDSSKNSWGTLNVLDYTFETNESKVGNGGAIYANTSYVNITDSKFTENTAALNGGAVYGAGNSVSVVKGTDSKMAIFDGNIANSKDNIGGGAYAVGSGTLDVDGYTFKNNYAAFRGGAIRINSGTSQTSSIKNSIFDSNESVQYGGAVSSQTTLNIDNTKFVNNVVANGSSDSRGGAIYAHGTSKLTITANGGTNLAIFQNNTGVQGGAICAANGTLSVSGYTFDGNKATSDIGGGAIKTNNDNITVNLTNLVFTNNTAPKGGALYLDSATSNNKKGTVNITDCSFGGTTTALGNKATKQGGAIWTNTGITLNLISNNSALSFFANNSATNNGGVIYLQGILNGSGYTFTSNSPDAIYVAGGTNNYTEND